MIRSPWLKHGLLNTLEHAVTRIADALSSLVLLWALPSETFAMLALAQAWVAPLLLVFVAPETVLYRDYAEWKSKGPDELAGRIRAFRIFAWGKAVAALLIASLVAVWVPIGGVYHERFLVLIWAFSLAMAPQLSGPDREFLRVDLQLKELNGLSLYQKLSLLAGTVIVIFCLPGRMDILAGMAAFSALSTAILARWRANRALAQMGASSNSIQGRNGPLPIRVIQESLTGFSIWNHLTGVANNWIQTLDLFCLSLFNLPARELGLYAAVLKLANFSYALPTALGNLFNLWIARRLATPEGRLRETDEIRRLTVWLGLGCALQAGLISLIAPWAIHFLSHGRWSGEEQIRTAVWLRWILVGTVLTGGSLLFTYWLQIRTPIKKMFLGLMVPWTAASFLIYWIAAFIGGPDGVAPANVLVAALLFPLLWLFQRNRKEPRAELLH